MSPGGAEPLHAIAVPRVARDPLERLEYIMEAHLTHAMQQAPGVLEHDARMMALVHQLRHELADPLVTPMKHGRIVIVANVLVLHHGLQVANHVGGSEIRSACRNQRLMHMQCARESCVDRTKVDRTIGEERMAAISTGFREITLRT